MGYVSATGFQGNTTTARSVGYVSATGFQGNRTALLGGPVRHAPPSGSCSVYSLCTMRAESKWCAWRERAMMVRHALRSLCVCNTLAGTSERSFIKEGCRQWLQFEKNDLCAPSLAVPHLRHCNSRRRYGAAAAINSIAVHVLIDLSGWTIFPGVEVFAMKPAPLQLCAFFRTQFEP